MCLATHGSPPYDHVTAAAQVRSSRTGIRRKAASMAAFINSGASHKKKHACYAGIDVDKGRIVPAMSPHGETSLKQADRLGDRALWSCLARSVH